MFRLTREVRFAVNLDADSAPQPVPTNTYAGYPSLTGLGRFFGLDVTFAGQLDPATNFLQNIKMMDALGRQQCIPLSERAIRETREKPALLLWSLFEAIYNLAPGAAMDSMRLHLSTSL